MRLYEFEQLNEASDFLDYSYNKAWIDTNPNLRNYDMSDDINQGIFFESHNDFLLINIKFDHNRYLFRRYGIVDREGNDREEIDAIEKELGTNMYQASFNEGCLRLNYDYEFLGVEGNMDVIKKSWKILRGIAMKKQKVYLNNEVFYLPENRNELIKFMK